MTGKTVADMEIKPEKKKGLFSKNKKTEGKDGEGGAD
jgi:hypothetical protein